MSFDFAVIFDMDGVLVDSMQGIHESFDELLQQEKIIFSETEHKRFFGQPLREVVLIWNQEYGLKLTPKEFSQRAFEIEYQKLIQRAEVDTGLISFLNELKQNQVPLAIGTASEKKRANAIIEFLKLKPFFKTIVSADDVPNRGGKKEIFLKAAKLLEIAPQKCVVIDDAPYGIQAATNAGMKTIGFAATPNAKKELEASDVVITDFGQISLEKIKQFIKTPKRNP
ncbi:MAG: HAD family phosphatase [Candidatus Diapherotrites archaeon]|uniref:HAD family phosphatase n=1 Tax=Candidatus Iainarchaeum sp. TaxID=3101447 RepID=A0A8T4L6B1_9ARCH|nr:HAD family phosphatase [Candidatus Diapherotrites archaeon]